MQHKPYTGFNQQRPFPSPGFSQQHQQQHCRLILEQWLQLQQLAAAAAVVAAALIYMQADRTAAAAAGWGVCGPRCSCGFVAVEQQSGLVCM